MVTLGFDPRAQFTNISRWIMNQCKTLSLKNTHTITGRRVKQLIWGLKNIFGLKPIFKSRHVARDILQKWELPATIASVLQQTSLKRETCLCEGGGPVPNARAWLVRWVACGKKGPGSRGKGPGKGSGDKGSKHHLPKPSFLLQIIINLT
jgi:hypothetical protein